MWPKCDTRLHLKADTESIPDEFSAMCCVFTPQNGAENLSRSPFLPSRYHLLLLAEPAQIVAGDSLRRFEMKTAPENSRADSRIMLRSGTLNEFSFSTHPISILARRLGRSLGSRGRSRGNLLRSLGARSRSGLTGSLGARSRSDLTGSLGARSRSRSDLAGSRGARSRSDLAGSLGARSRSRADLAGGLGARSRSRADLAGSLGARSRSDLAGGLGTRSRSRVRHHLAGGLGAGSYFARSLSGGHGLVKAEPGNTQGNDENHIGHRDVL